jgi:hypothetical protein
MAPATISHIRCLLIAVTTVYKRALRPSNTAYLIGTYAVENCIRKLALSNWQQSAARLDPPLAPQSKGFDDGTVALNIIALDIIEQSATLSHQHQQPPAGMVIFLMHLKMFG